MRSLRVLVWAIAIAGAGMAAEFELDAWHFAQLISSEVGSTMSVVARTVPDVSVAVRRIMGK